MPAAVNPSCTGICRYPIVNDFAFPSNIFPLQHCQREVIVIWLEELYYIG